MNDSFENEYRKICEKYGRVVESCGCCPPFIIEANNEELEEYFKELEIVKNGPE